MAGLVVPLAATSTAHAAGADESALQDGCSRADLIVTCTYTTQGETAFTVPAGVTKIDVTATGGRGSGENGGSGATVTGSLGVTPGETLYAQVNVGGGGGTHPGGGASTVQTCQIGANECDLTGDPATDPRLIVAAGGGGAGGDGGLAGGLIVEGDNAVFPGGAGGAAATAGTAGEGPYLDYNIWNLYSFSSRAGAAGGAAALSGGGSGGAGGSAAHTVAPLLFEASSSDGSAGEEGDSFTGGDGGSSEYGGAGGGGGGGFFGGGGGGGGGGTEVVLLDPESPAGLIAGLGGGGGGGGSNHVPAGGNAVPAPDSVGPGVTVSYHVFNGFQAPVNNNSSFFNRINAGRSVPMKFSLAGDQGMDIVADDSPDSRRVTCPSDPALIDTLEVVAAISPAGLSYDPATDTYTYTWKTSKEWASTCREFTLTLYDGTKHSALFQFTK
ncbi:PxKF domain-containing protein [Streptomyces sp. NPDC126514]|uniref:PxKF domain-containing protein n=1 Tax=Streptomyces sp. NPDC126514 TaxID=3155210 RepID=UPI00331887B9